jgi:hypothetical protein
MVSPVVAASSARGGVLLPGARRGTIRIFGRPSSSPKGADPSTMARLLASFRDSTIKLTQSLDRRSPEPEPEAL